MLAECFLGSSRELRAQALYEELGGTDCFLGLSPEEQELKLYEALGGTDCFLGLSRQERAYALYVAAGGSDPCFRGSSPAEQARLFYEVFAGADACFPGMSPDMQDYSRFLAISGGANLHPECTLIEGASFPFTFPVGSEGKFYRAKYVWDNGVNPPLVFWGDAVGPIAAASTAWPEYAFMREGATRPWYGQITTPVAAYDVNTDTTWFAFEAWNEVERRILVQTFNHTTSEWSGPFLVAISTMVDDDHGVPSICRDADGYWHVFYGVHVGAMRHSVTSAPDDPRNWTELATIGTRLTYPHPVLVGSALYLFARRSSVDLTEMPLVLYKGTVAAGVVTWGSQTDIGTYGSDSRVYTGYCVLRGTKIHIMTTRSDAASTFLRDVHYLVYDTGDDQIENYNNSVSNSVPLSRATLDASYRIVVQPTPAGSGGDAPFCFDAAGDVHMLYMDGPGFSNLDAQNIYHMRLSGGTWSAPVLIGIGHSWASGYTVTPDPNGGVVVYWVEVDSAVDWLGGDIHKRTRSSAGVWSAAELVQAATTFALGELSQVFKGLPECRVIWCEMSQDAAVESGLLKGFAYGDGGYLQNEEVVFSYVHPAVALTNGRLTATATDDSEAGSYVIAQASVFIAPTEKRYWEISATNFVVGSTGGAIGLLNRSGGFVNYLGADTPNTVGYYRNGQAVQEGAFGFDVTIETWDEGDNIGVAVDRSVEKIWFRKNGGDWNNDVIGNQNPATGVGGYDLDTNQPSPAVMLGTTGDSMTFLANAADWVYVAPSGFTDFHGEALPDTTAPLLGSAIIEASGDVVAFAFNEPVKFGAGGNGGFTISMSGGAATLTYLSGEDSGTLRYTPSRTIDFAETGTGAFTQPGNGVEDTTGNDLETIASFSVTNNSSPALLVNEDFEGTGTPTGCTIVTGSPNFDNTSAPLIGAQDCAFTGVVDVSCKWAFSAVNKIYVRLKFTVPTLPGGAATIFYAIGSGSQNAGVRLKSDGTFLFREGGADKGTATVSGITATTEYYLFISCEKGTGANAIYSVEFADTTTRVGSGNQYMTFTGGALTEQIAAFQPYREVALIGSFRFDEVKVSSVGWPS